VLAETNQGYINSKIPLRVNLFCAKQAVGYPPEVNRSLMMLENFAAWKGECWENVLFSFYASPSVTPADIDTLRNTADTTMLLTAGGENCGIAYANDPTNTVGTVKKDCALGYYSFGHELGHMFGAHHNRETGEVGFLPYGYGFLLQPPGKSWFDGYRTILA
jgi:hypothetical protein